MAVTESNRKPGATREREPGAPSVGTQSTGRCGTVWGPQKLNTDLPVAQQVIRGTDGTGSQQAVGGPVGGARAYGRGSRLCVWSSIGQNSVYNETLAL